MLACIAVARLAACTSPPQQQGQSDLLDFLQGGSTRREEVQMRLGEPNALYEGNRILAYRLRRDQGGYVLVKGGSDCQEVRYNLMLAFDAQGVLRRHTLVEVNPR
ncbi:hypothetical protein [uncultured Piscinibacter sp.]|uniref:hypothetical protein n=1 Tax=uncultured Piscinibacter sp. TaxID=1131835 RepID=UPI002613D0DC|nr:hypothetical protein [uncultured Piscinibacter sp.]